MRFYFIVAFGIAAVLQIVDQAIAIPQSDITNTIPITTAATEVAANNNNNNSNITTTTSIPSTPAITTGNTTHNDGAITENILMIEISDAGNDRVQQQETMKTAMKSAGIVFTPRLSFTKLMNAFSVNTTPNNIEKIRKMNGVLAVWTLKSITTPHVTTIATVNQLDDVHKETGVKDIQQRTQYNGHGIKVGVVDSGIDYTHPALGGCFGLNCRVAYGYDFVGDAFQGMGTQKPDADPRDTCNGHGTHVAGIIGGNDTKVTGVAPGVIFGAYRVFGCHCKLSIVSPVRWADGPDGLAVERLASHGILVVAAAGNDGNTGLWATSSPGLADNALSVAAIDSSKYFATVFSISVLPQRIIEYIPSRAGQVLNFTNVPLSLPNSNDTFGCTPFTNNRTGHVVLVQRGGCVMDQKATMAGNAGAVAVIVYNNVDGDLPPLVDNRDAISLVGIPKAEGEALIEAMGANTNGKTVRVTFESTARYIVNSNGGKVSSFSSWGAGPMLELKPDLAAPGGQIYSTFPMSLSNGYATLSGTSMASPYIAGSLALYLQAHNGTNVTNANIRETFQNAAKPAVQSSTRHWIASPVVQQGAGVVDVQQAVFGKTRVTPSRLALNDTDQLDSNGAHITRTITVANNHGETKTYRLSHLPALSVQGFNSTGMVPSVPVQRTAHAIVTFSQRNVEVPAGQSREITITIAPPRRLPDAEKWIYSGYVVVDPISNNTSQCSSKASSQEAVHVPYMGMKGRLRDVHVFRTPGPYPFLRNLSNNVQISQPNETATYTMKDFDFPWVYIRLEYATRYAFVRVHQADDQQLLGLVPDSISELLTRNDDTADNRELALPWMGGVETTDGNHTVSNLPNGRYYLRVMALRPFGDINNDNDYDIWQSPTVTIARPT
ncbi:peptidase S8/S53 domain-containing protein [Syncephalis plumigaleata]|nr:peptidase S8/S53 domain-containing protein [Syncephalis plumigaleata]